MGLFFWAETPTLLEWVTSAGYLIAAVLCFRAGRAAQRSLRRSEPFSPFFLIAALAVVLGINKEFEVQTLMIRIGRTLATSEGWYEWRRMVQKIFVLATLIIGLTILGRFVYQHIEFFKAHLGLACGVAAICLYCFLRWADINYIELFGSGRTGSESVWPIEISGVALLIFGATRGRARSLPRNATG
jgi:hypothetical protein